MWQGLKSKAGPRGQRGLKSKAAVRKKKKEKEKKSEVRNAAARKDKTFFQLRTRTPSLQSLTNTASAPEWFAKLKETFPEME